MSLNLCVESSLCLGGGLDLSGAPSGFTTVDADQSPISGGLLQNVAPSAVSFDPTAWHSELSQAPPGIIDQLKIVWPRETEAYTEGRLKGGKILVTYQEGRLIGAVSLKPEKGEGGAVASEFVLTIQTSSDFRKKGYGRSLFEYACSIVTERGGVVSLADQSGGAGEALYGGEKTREKFDISVKLTALAFREYYLRKQVEGGKKPLRYEKVDEIGITAWCAIEKIDSLRHLIRYLEQHPQDKEQLKKDDSFFRYIDFQRKGTCDSEDAKAYLKSLETLRDHL